MANRIEHWMLYADKTVMSYVNPVSKFIPPSVMINLTCLNARNFGISQSEYAYVMQNETGPLTVDLL